MKKKSIRIISQTANGRVYKCSQCDCIHLEYKNLYFNFSYKAYLRFKAYFFTIDGEYWEEKNKRSFHKRKVIIPIGHPNFMITLNSIEVYELKTLLCERKSIKRGLELKGGDVFEKLSVN